MLKGLDPLKKLSSSFVVVGIEWWKWKLGEEYHAGLETVSWRPAHAHIPVRGGESVNGRAS